MARRYSDEENEVIRILTGEGVNATEIWRRLRDGRAGLPGPSSISKRSVQEKAARFKLHAIGEPAPEEGDEVDSADAVIRESLRYATRKIRELKATGKRDRNTAADLREWIKTAAEARKHFQSPQVTGRNTQQAEAGATTPAKDTITMLAEAAREPASRPSLPPSSVGNGDGATAEGGAAQPITDQGSEPIAA